VLVIMTDGFAERTNGTPDRLGYATGRDLLLRYGAEPPESLIRQFVAAADRWSNGQAQDDDITVVVIKRQPSPVPSSEHASPEHLSVTTSATQS
jgi:serine phosphatase RsbU (regulator of sigma subunit)